MDDTDSTGSGPLRVGTSLGLRHRFRLDRWLGGGSFGAVYEATTLSARDGEIPEKVAIKLLNADLPDRARRQTLQREIAALAAIRSRRIPRLIDSSLDGPHPFLAVEYFPHGTLAELQARVGPLDEAEALSLLESLLEALEAAHEVGVLHLDVKPANVLLDGVGGFVLVDFGIANAPRAGSSMPGLGSKGWQSPEQADRKVGAFDLRTDLHGVGVTVWSALTGLDLASRQGEVLQMRAAGSSMTLPPLSIARRTPFHPEIEGIVMSLLARDPTARPGSAAAVLDRVRALREGRDGAPAVTPGSPVPIEEAERVVEAIIDPLVAKAMRSEARTLRRFHDKEALCQQDERSFHAFVLVHGAVRVLRDGVMVARVDREGEFLGEIAALTAEPRNATVVAEGPCYVRLLDAAQLESLVVSNPALAVRLIRSMASRFRATRVEA